MEINGGEAPKKLKNVQYAGTRSHVNVCVTDIVAKAGSAWVDSGKNYPPIYFDYHAKFGFCVSLPSRRT